LAGTYRSSVAGTVNYVNICPVFVFMLPVLAEGEFLSAAALRFNMGKSGTPTYNADIYGLGFRPSGTVRQTDYFIGTLDTTDATLIQDDFGNPTIGSATARTTDDVGDTALLSYLNAQYTAGAVGGDYVFLRLSPDYTDFPVNPPVASVGYTMTAANNASAGNVPQLTLTVIPEPGSYLLLLGATGLLAARRRR
jgi:hypothetical protein